VACRQVVYEVDESSTTDALHEVLIGHPDTPEGGYNGWPNVAEIHDADSDVNRVASHTQLADHGGHLVLKLHELFTVGGLGMTESEASEGLRTRAQKLPLNDLSYRVVQLSLDARWQHGLKLWVCVTLLLTFVESSSKSFTLTPQGIATVLTGAAYQRKSGMALPKTAVYQCPRVTVLSAAGGRSIFI